MQTVGVGGADLLDLSLGAGTLGDREQLALGDYDSGSTVCCWSAGGCSEEEVEAAREVALERYQLGFGRVGAAQRALLGRTDAAGLCCGAR